MNFSKYQNTLPYPEKPVAPRPSGPFTKLTYDEALEYAEAVKVYKAEMIKWEVASENYRKESLLIQYQFEREAIEEAGLAGHPKAEKVFAKAWERGHSSGYEEVFNVLEDLAELVL
jgi:hypothetical protein